jgi:uncharacterized membrane protein
MAGIGFSLDRFFRRGTYASNLGAYLAAALLFAGPSILSVMSLFALRAVSRARVGVEPTDLFIAVLNYSLCASMLLTGLTSLIQVRALGDRLFNGEIEAVLPYFRGAVLWGGGLHLAVGASFWFAVDVPLEQKLWFIALFTAIGVTWQAMIFLDCLSRYGFALLALVGGYGASVVLAAIGGRSLGIVGLSMGFTMGLLLSFAGMSSRIAAEYPFPAASLKTWAGRRLYPSLLGIGFFYSLGLCADRITFWVFHPFTQQVGPFASYPPYEMAVLLAFLTTIPGQALLVFRLEVAFYRRLLGYQASIVGRATLADIEKNREEIGQSLLLSLERIFTVQGSATLVALVLAPQLISAFSIPPESVYMFRTLAVGALLNVVLLGAVLVMLYMVLYREALLTSVLFSALQVGGALLTLKIGFPSFGFGYLLACLLTLVFAALLLARRLRDLDYHQFSGQPVTDE